MRDELVQFSTRDLFHGKGLKFYITAICFVVFCFICLFTYLFSFIIVFRLYLNLDFFFSKNHIYVLPFMFTVGVLPWQPLHNYTAESGSSAALTTTHEQLFYW